MGSPWASTRGVVDVFKHFKNFFNSIHFTRTGAIRSDKPVHPGGRFPIPIALAILMNEADQCKVQAVCSDRYLPAALHIHDSNVRYAVGSSCATERVFSTYCAKIGLESINFLMNRNTLSRYTSGQGVWQDAGWGTIIYMATLSGLDTQMYEAAHIDGASSGEPYGI